MHRHVAEYEQKARDALEAANTAVCFDIGDSSEFHDMPMQTELCRLPYPCCWLNFRMTDVNFGALCRERAGALEMDLFSEYGREWVYVFHAALHVKNEEWDVLCYPREQVPIAQSTAGLILTFLTALNCCNVRRILVEAPAALNAARSRRGKLPIFEHWTLDLRIPSGGVDEDIDLGGTHASPRLHLRRGHVKRSAKSGRWWWVRAHIVGRKELGLITKGYGVRLN